MTPGLAWAGIRGVRSSRWPWLTLAVTGATAAVIAGQLVQPTLLQAWQWDVEQLRAGQYWRIITGVFVHSGGPAQMVFNLLGLLVIGWLAEQQWSRLAWAAGAIAGVAAAEVAAFWWHPVGGGISVALGGLVGLIMVSWLFDTGLPGWFRFGMPALYLIGAGGVTALSDVHGPPVFAGALIGLLLLGQRRTVPLVRKHG